MLLPLCSYFVARMPIDERYAIVSNLSIVGFALPSYVAAVRWLGPRRAAALIGALSLFAVCVEALSITTGFPYGRFTYSEVIGTRLGGLVPWTVPFAWAPLVLGVTYLARRLHPRPGVARVGIGASLLLLLDLMLDPAAVRLGFWAWEASSAYYGIPLSNFAGWLLTGVVGCLAADFAARDRPAPPPPQLAHSLLLISAFWAGACAWLGFVIPTLCGALCTILTLYLVLRHPPTGAS